MLVYKTSDGRFSIFQDGGGPTPWILKVENINFQSGSEAQYASPCQISYANRSSRPGHMAKFRFFKTAAVRHFGFVLRVFGPPT